MFSKKSLEVKSVHKSNDSLKKVCKSQITFHEVDFLFHFFSFHSFVLNDTNFVFELYGTYFDSLLFPPMLFKVEYKIQTLKRTSK